MQTTRTRTAGAWQSGRVGRAATAFVVGSVLLVVLASGWLALRGWTAAEAATLAGEELRLAERSYRSQDLAGAAEHVSVAGHHLDRAHRATGDPVWALATTLPAVGDDVDAVRTVLRGAAGTVAAVDPVVRLLAEGGGAGVAGAQRGSPDAGHAAALLTLARDARLAPALRHAHSEALASQQDVVRVSGGSLHPRVAAQVDAAADVLARGSSGLGTAAAGAELLPALLAPEGSPPLLVVVQTPAEVRSLGGLAGLVLVVGERDGRPQVLESYSGSSVPPADVPLLTSARLEGWYGLFGDRAGRYLVDATALPDARDASALLAEAHVRRGGDPPAGVVITDLTVLAALLEVTGPVPLPDGRQLTAEGSGDLLQHQVYVEQPDPAAQDAFFAGAARAVLDALVQRGADGPTIARAVAVQASRGRLSVWSPDPRSQALAEELGVDGHLLADPTAVGVFLNDGTAAKMQHFLTTRAEARARPDGRSTVRLELVSTAPGGDGADTLPDYVAGGAERLGLPRGTQRVQVTVVGPVGDGPSEWRVDGVVVATASSVVDGRGAGAVSVDVGPGDLVVVEVDLASSTGLTSTSLVTTPGVQVCVPACS